MSKITLLELAERFEAALQPLTGPAAWQLDGDIAEAMGFAPAECQRGGGDQSDRWRSGDVIRYQAPLFSSSIGAAMTLLDDYRQSNPEQCGYAPSVLRLHDGSGKADVHISPNGHMVHGSGVTPALALTAAALRARHALALSKGSDDEQS